MHALCVVQVWWAVCAYIVCGPGMVGCVCIHCVWSRYGGLCVHTLCVVQVWWAVCAYIVSLCVNIFVFISMYAFTVISIF